MDDLRDLLLSTGYTTDEVLERIGDHGQAGLGRNTTVPADVALAGAMDAQAVVIRLFILQQRVPRSAFPERALSLLLGYGLVAEVGEHVVALVDVRPYGSPDDGGSGFLVSDLTPGLDATTVRTRHDYVLGASPASLTLAEITMRTPVGRALDLGTGCGVQSLHLARHADEVVATDLNPRALDLARFSVGLSDIDVVLREGSLFEPVSGEHFDLIVSNPPYVMSPPGDDGARLTYREGNLEADGLVEAVVRGAAEHLKPGGSLQLLTNWAIVDGQPWQERLRGWVEGTGLDCWVVERERLDRFSYIEMWLTDAGLAGSAEWRPAYDAWLAYFERLGISEVGMGWILLTASGRDEPHLRFETWPHAVAQPVGDVFARNRAAVDASRLPLDALLASRPALVEVVQETIGDPGAADPEFVVFRQRVGMLRAIKATTASAAVLGALDGDLSVGQVVQAVAELLDAAPEEVAAEVVPVVRDALLDQLLRLG